MRVSIVATLLVVFTAGESVDKMPMCDGLTKTMVDRKATVQLSENLLGDWVASAPNIPGLFSVSGFHAAQDGRVTVGVTFYKDNMWSKIGVPNPAAWCEKKGNHTEIIDIRSICRYAAADTADDYFYKVQFESTFGTDCLGQKLGVCRVLKVSKGSAPRRWVESQDGPEGPGGTSFGGPGGSMATANKGASLLLDWTTCPTVQKIETVVAESGTTLAHSNVVV